MDLIAKFLEDLNWESLMFSSLRILFILLVAWVGLRIVRRVLRNVKQRLLQMAEREQSAGEDEKRVETLIRLVSDWQSVLAPKTWCATSSPVFL